MALTELIAVMAFFVPLFSSYHMENSWGAGAIAIWLAAGFALGVAGFKGSLSFSIWLHGYEQVPTKARRWVVSFLSIAHLGGIYALGVLSNAIVKALVAAAP